MYRLKCIARHAGVLDSSQEPSRQYSDDFDSSGSTSRGLQGLDVGSSSDGSSNVGTEGSRAESGGPLDVSREAGEEGSDVQPDSNEGLSADEPDPFQTVVIEQCIAWGGELRVRMQITLAIAGASPLPQPLTCPPARYADVCLILSGQQSHPPLHIPLPLAVPGI